MTEINYSLPFDLDAILDPHLIQINLQRGFASEDDKSYSFMLPKETPVLASREGRVIDLHRSSRIEKAILGSNLLIIAPSKLLRNSAHSRDYAVVDHGDKTYAKYDHVSTSVKVGDKVERGQPIGKVNQILKKFGSHIHFQVFQKPYTTDLKNIEKQSISVKFYHPRVRVVKEDPADVFMSLIDTLIRQRQSF